MQWEMHVCMHARTSSRHAVCVHACMHVCMRASCAPVPCSPCVDGLAYQTLDGCVSVYKHYDANHAPTYDMAAHFASRVVHKATLQCRHAVRGNPASLRDAAGCWCVRFGPIFASVSPASFQRLPGLSTLSGGSNSSAVRSTANLEIIITQWVIMTSP